MSSTSSLHDHLGHWLRRLSDEVHLRFERELAKHSVTVAQWNVLITVYSGHGATIRDVARYIDIDTGAVSRLVDRLVEKGLMRRMPDPASKRSILLALTDAGQALTPRLAVIADQNDAHYFDSLEPAKRARLVGLIHQLVDSDACTTPTGDVEGRPPAV
ncbi:MarR family winged helix-turn-helix transcriptional regulator [Streptomyces puniciscabiei]